MWRVDNRKLPPDITVDGGSDWIAINRNYSRYLVTEKHPYLIGLKRYYEFSLLPAEVSGEKSKCPVIGGFLKQTADV